MSWIIEYRAGSAGGEVISPKKERLGNDPDGENYSPRSWQMLVQKVGTNGAV